VPELGKEGGGDLVRLCLAGQEPLELAAPAVAISRSGPSGRGVNSASQAPARTRTSGA
jgi:hypothetical protein